MAGKTLHVTCEPLGEWVDHRQFATYEYGADGWQYRMTAPATFRFPRHLYRLITTVGPGWQTAPGEIDVQGGYCWDGPSGPAVNDESAVVGSLLHDILCTPVTDEQGRVGYPCGYLAAHRLYREVCRVQGMHRGRAWYHWGALVACNWYVRWRDCK